MVRKVATDEEILDSLEKVMKRTGVVNSQRKLKELVEKELSKSDPDYTLSAKRLRLTAIDSSFIRMEIHYREGEQKNAIHRCPVCDSKLKFVKNMTIFGGKVTLGYKCKKCPYWTGLKKMVPTRYIFTLK